MGARPVTQHAIIQADYTNWRTVAGRKVLQLVFEVPIEQTADVMAKLGVPMPGESKWCAIALLENGRPANESGAGKPKPTQKPSENTAADTIQTGGGLPPTTAITAAAGTSETKKDHKPFASLPLSQQAAIRTDDKAFQDFLEIQTPIHHEESYADAVRAICGVQSRADIKPGTPAGMAWIALESSFQAYLTDQKYAGVTR